MLPDNHHPDDARWIAEQLRLLPYGYRHKATQEYSEAYVQAHESEPLEHKKDNRARFAANTRLRIFVQKIAQNALQKQHACYTGTINNENH